MRVRFVMPTVAAVLAMAGLATVASATPTNDAFADRIDASATPFTHTASTVDATDEPGEPAPACAYMPAGSVWYSFTNTGSEDRSVVVDTVGSDYDTVVAVYQGDSLETLTPVACNDDYHSFQSRVAFAAAPASSFAIQVTGFSGDAGDLVLHLDQFPPPDNDSFAASMVVGTTPFSHQQGTIGASAEAGEPVPACGTSTNSVWFSYTHPSVPPLLPSEVVVDTLGSDFDTVLAVYQGASVDSLTEVACNDDATGLQSAVRFTPAAGETYHVQVTGYAGDAGALSLQVEGCVPLASRFVGGLACTGLGV